jgi:hypothetical protein
LPLDTAYKHVDPRHLALLQRLDAHRVPHSKRTLIEHLVGTHDLLREWGNDDAVCCAGLFHSIYGTRVFAAQCADFSSRDEIRAVIGDQAEALAYLFCVADRDAFFAAARSSRPVIRDAVNQPDVPVTRQALSALLEVEAANLVEHMPHRGRSTLRAMRWYREAFADCRSLISAAAAAAMNESLDRFNGEVERQSAG